MQLDSAIGFCRHPQLVGVVRDTIRIEHVDGGMLILLASGSDGAFSSYCSPISALLLDEFVAAWSASAGAPEARLLESFRIAETAFIMKSRSDGGEDSPAGTLLAVYVIENTLHCAWIGGDAALVVRGTRVVWSSTPHTLQRDLLLTDPHLEVDGCPNIVTRCVGTWAKAEPAYERMELHRGDVIVLSSRIPFVGSAYETWLSVNEAVEEGTPRVLAERVAQHVFKQYEPPYVAVVVVRAGDNRGEEIE